MVPAETIEELSEIFPDPAPERPLGEVSLYLTPKREPRDLLKLSVASTRRDSIMTWRTG
jgi:hypothetical protein